MSFSTPRSIKRCIFDGWRVFALNWHAYLKFVLIYNVVGSLGVALFLEFITQYAGGQLLAAHLLGASGMQRDLVRFIAMPDMLQSTVLLFSGVAAVAGYYLVVARRMQQMAHYSRQGVLPPAAWLAQGDQTLLAARRLFALDFPAVVVLFALVAVLSYAAHFHSPLWLLILIAIWPLWLVWRDAARVERLVYGHTYARSWRNSFKVHSRRFGGLFIVQLLGILPRLFFATVCFLPAVLYLCNVCAVSVSRLADDPAALPVWLPAAYVLLNTAALTVYAVLAGATKWAFAMKAGQDVTAPAICKQVED